MNESHHIKDLRFSLEVKSFPSISKSDKNHDGQWSIGHHHHRNILRWQVDLVTPYKPSVIPSFDSLGVFSPIFWPVGSVISFKDMSTLAQWEFPIKVRPLKVPQQLATVISNLYQENHLYHHSCESLSPQKFATKQQCWVIVTTSWSKCPLSYQHHQNIHHHHHGHWQQCESPSKVGGLPVKLNHHILQNQSPSSSSPSSSSWSMVKLSP